MSATGSGNLPQGPGPVGSGKSIAAIAAGALATIVVWVIDQATGKVLPPEIVAAVQTLATTAAVYFTPHGGG